MSGAGSGSEDDATAATIAATATTPERGRPLQPGDAVDVVAPAAVDAVGEGSPVGRYLLKARLGEGAMGVVWSAHDPQLDRDVAIKLVHPELANAEASVRLEREARAMAKLSHRSVITIHDSGKVDGQLFIAMELVRGTTLGQILRERDAAAIADWKRWLAMMIEAGRGLAEAHRNGVLHRDFKPDNVLVDGTGRVCVGDFGLATLNDSPGASRQWNARAIDDTSFELTTTGALLGTPVYMSPQQLRGETIDARADQFAFCVATWEALYGRRPFVVKERGIDAIPALIAEIERGATPPANASVPDGLRTTLQRGLSVDPAARWADMDALLAAIETSIKRPSAIALPRRRRRKWPLVLGAAAVAIAVASTVYIVGFRESDPKIARREMFTVPLRARIAMSADGSRLVVGGSRLEVYPTSGAGDPWHIELPEPVTDLRHLEVDANEVVFAMFGTHAIHRWPYARKGPISTMVEDAGGTWRGLTLAGDVIELDDYSALIVRDRVSGREVMRMPTQNPAEVIAVSPDRRRIAFLDQVRTTGYLVIHDVTTKRELRSERLVDPTAITWLDETALLYAAQGGVVYRVDVGDTLGPPSEIYALSGGAWVGRLEARGALLYAIEVRSVPRGNLVERGPRIERSEFERGMIPIAWTSATSVLAWNRESKRVVRYTGRSFSPTPATVPGEPANATLAGETLIASVRETGGRETIAVSTADGRVRWRHVDKKTHAVRCAGDRKPPCFAIRVDDRGDQIFAIDPETGTLATTPLFVDKLRSIEDIAVRSDGQRIVIGGSVAPLREIDVTGAVVREISQRMSLARSVAYDPAGGVLVAGSGYDRTQRVGAVRAGYLSQAIAENGDLTSLEREGDGVLLLIRASDDGARITSVTRVYEAMLVELRP